MTKPTRVIESWHTIAVTALPAGWRNVWDDPDGTAHTSPCPAVLVQEHRSDVLVWDDLRPDGTVNHRGLRSQERHLDPPYETRAVFADYDDGRLDPAHDISNYGTTLGPGEEPGDVDRSKLIGTGRVPQ